jgi:membrane protease subunit (stomatin/prohibitin family)
VCGNVEQPYTRDKIDSQLKSELLTALQPAFARISAMGVRYSAVPAHTKELAQALNEELSQSWGQMRGIEVAAFGVNSIVTSPEDEAMIKELQRAAVMRDPTMAAANLAASQADAMRMAASNIAGAAVGFMGMGMANAMGGGMNMQGLYGMGAGGGATPARGGAAPAAGATAAGATAAGATAAGATAAPAAAPGTWTCSCGAQNTGRFCGNCGSPKPQPADGPWTCSCGTQNTGRFCSNCGSPRP